MRIEKRLLTLAAFLAAFTLAGIALPAYAQDGALPSQISLSMTPDPTTSINVTWTTIGSAVSNPVVLVWQANERESSAATFTASATTRAVSSSTIAGVTQKTFYSAAITGLKKGTDYSYRVGTHGHTSDVRSFKTAGDNNGSFTFIYFSDSQTRDIHARG